MLTHDVCREEGDGAVLSLDFHGVLTFEEVEQVMADITAHPEEYELEPDETFSRGFNVKVCERSEVYNEDWDFMEWVYHPVDAIRVDTPADGVVIVTQVAPDFTWPHRCYRHLDRVAVCGLPGDQFLPPESGEGSRLVDNYLYVCRECEQQIAERRKAQSEVWRGEIERRRRIGLPDRLVFA